MRALIASNGALAEEMHPSRSGFSRFFAGLRRPYRERRKGKVASFARLLSIASVTECPLSFDLISAGVDQFLPLETLQSLSDTGPSYAQHQC